MAEYLINCEDISSEIQCSEGYYIESVDSVVYLKATGVSCANSGGQEYENIIIQDENSPEVTTPETYCYTDTSYPGKYFKGASYYAQQGPYPSPFRDSGLSAKIDRR